MEIIIKENNLLLKNVKDFNLLHIFECGQCFRFNKLDDSSYIGVAKGKVLRISQKDDTVILYDTTESDFYNIWYDFFDFSRDYTLIKNRLDVDPIMHEAIKYGDGIRILNQDLWEMIVSFIISSSNNIPRIKGIIERFSMEFGRPIKYQGETFYAFPTPDELYGLTREDLSVIRAGYRDKYIIDAINKFYEKNLTCDILFKMPTPEAKKALMTILGVGNKVSDCILLFGMNRADSFPIDVWIKRIIEYCYFDNKEQTINTISQFAQNKFSTLGGYAQQYLFFYARENKIGTVNE